MEGYFLIGAFIFFIIAIKHTNKLENTSAYKNATPEEQLLMKEGQDKESKDKMARATQEYYDNYGDDKSAISKSSTSSSSSFTYNNPSTGLPMTNGVGGGDAGGIPYGH